MDKSSNGSSFLRIKTEQLEAMAEAVHEAIYLDLCRKFIRDDRFLTNVPYSNVDEGLRDINRTAVRTVVNSVNDQIGLSTHRSLEAEAGWRDAVALAESYKSGLEKATVHIRFLEKLIESSGIKLEQKFRSAKPKVETDLEAVVAEFVGAEVKPDQCIFQSP